MSAPAAALIICVLAPAISAAPAAASEAITNFETTSSDATAGAHPDLSTSFTLENPGEPEAAQNIVFNAPKGVFGNPGAIAQCTASDLAFDRCPTDSQVGLVTVYAEYLADTVEECKFEYGETEEYGRTAPCSPRPPF